MTDYPQTWAFSKLEDVGEIITGNTPSKKEPANFGGPYPFVKPGDLDKGIPIVTTEETLSEMGANLARILRPGAVLVSCIGNLGKIGIAGTALATNQQINSIEFNSDLVDDRYGYHYCRTLKEWMEAEASATTVTILNKGRFSQAQILIPPLNEQKRIADKLDQTLAIVERAKARLARVPVILNQFRQSVLAAATDGRLTEDWRAELPEANETRWSRYRLDDIFQIFSGYAFKKAQYSSNGVKLLQIANVGYGELMWEETSHIPPDTAKSFSQFSLKAGDVILALNRPITNDRLKVAQLGASDLPCTLYQRVGCLRNKTEYLEKYLFLCALTEEFKRQIEQNLQGSDQPYINTSALPSLTIAVPSIPEQGEIVRRVETLFALADRIETRYQTISEKVDKLTQSLLAKAFRGELVPQDPNDEPASVLLDRIRAARAAAPAAKRGRRKNSVPA